MSTPNVLKAAEGLDIYPDGVIAQDWPWTVSGGGLTTPQIVSGAGPFGTKVLSFNRGTTYAEGLRYRFPSTGMWTRNNATTAGKSVFGFNMWYRCDTVPTTTTTTPIVAWGTTAASAQTIPLLGISQTSGGGTQLAFPSTVASIATSPYLFPINTGVWYWVSIRFIVYPNAQCFASYTVSGVPLQDNVPITFGSDPMGTNICNQIVGYGGGVLGTWSMDDMLIQASSGADADWPPGFTTGVPNNPVMASITNITPRQISLGTISGDGSFSQWTPDTIGLPNWQAATQPGHNVEALDANLTDTYKATVSSSVTLTDCIGVVVRATTNKYLNVEPATKDSSASAQVNNPGVVSKGTSRFISLMERNQADQVWTKTTIEAAEFGQHSI